MHVNLFGVLAAAVAAWLFGAAWYMALGRLWRDALRSRREAPLAGNAADTKPPVAALVISFVAELVMAWMLAGLVAHLGGPTMTVGVLTGFFCWLGFVATTLVTGDAYLAERPSKTAIDGAHWLGVLLIEGLVIGAIG